MGVQGLWKLLESTGRPVTLESLEGKILAVDVSLWLHQAMRGMRDEGGNVKANAHLHVLFNRICKLLFYRIRPIFVFDGSVPELKRQTMVARRQRREIAAGKSKKTSEKLIKNYLQSHALHAVLGEAGGSGQKKTAPVLKKIVSTEPNMYELPFIPPVVLNESESDSDAEVDPWVDSHHHQNLQDVDIDSDDFKALPPELQHEMIIEMKETRKRNSWEMIQSLPAHSEEFSDYQLKKLLQKGKMTQRLDTLRKEMSERNAGEIASMLDLESGGSKEVEAGRIISEDAQHYLLVKRQSKMEDLTGDEDASDREDDSKPVAAVRAFPPDDFNVRGHIQSDDVKGQENSSQKSQEQEVVNASDSKPDEEHANRETEIAQVVKNFFSAVPTTSSATLVQMKKVETVSPDVIVLDHEDIVGHMSSDGQNISQRSSKEEVVVLDTPQKSLRKDEICFHGDDEVIILVDELGESKPSLTCDPTASSTNQSGLSLNLNTAGKLGSTEVDRSLAPQAVTKVLQPASSVVISVEDQDVSDNLRASSSKETITKDTSSEMDAKRKNVEDEGMLDSWSDDDDFIEITLDQVSHRQEDELFPASVFIPSADMSKEARATSPKVDINPLESRNDDDIVAMDTEVPIDENEEREVHQEEDDEEDNDVDEMDQDILEDDEEIHEEEDEGQDDIQMEMQRDAARQEWEAMNVNEVSNLEGNLENQRAVLQTERGKQERVAATVTDLMYSESKELLELFGIPYINSPQEAEAQCAFLDLTDQTSGTITDDSDVWLFGGRVVYRNFFSKGKDVECFKDVNVEKQMLLDRSKLVTLAMLLGSDYTDGVSGIGWVTAMELLTEFPGEGIHLLKSFKSWWDVAHKQLMPPVESQLKGKLRKLTLSSGFPCQRVIDAYWNPVIDESTETFTWDSPDLGLLRDFARDKLGWTRSKADETLLPVIKRLNEKKIQSKISSFFHLETQPRQVTSKRLKRVLNRLRNPQQAKKEEEEKIKEGGKKLGRVRKTETVDKEITSKKRKQSSKVRNSKQFSTKDNNGDVNDDVSMETTEERNENVERKRKGRRRNLMVKTEEDDEAKSASDTQSSEDEYVLPKKAKIVLEDSGSTDAGRHRRTRRKKEVVDYKEEKEASEEFLEIGEAMSQKTEGVIGYKSQRKNTKKLGTNGTSTFVVRTENQCGQFETESCSTTSNLRSDSTILKSKQGEVTLHSSQVKKAKGRQVKGQRGKGKGHSGQKGIGKVVSLKGGRTKVGPKLSESSSSDSD
ncbi:DNA repair protein complementing XP-G cells-like [Asterias rubens]|uniref:DNA repair protein complementing XP-G cells-like n=1 Tax=Asterias rubens TaxID=7604 RepID=UPI0014559918|nr:DNA repair protein complementing XP-G cells-like [Asterias rubens]